MQKAKLQQYSKAEKEIRHHITTELKNALGADFDAKLIEIDYPPKPEMGDYSVPCFGLAKKLKKSPAEIAALIAGKIAPNELLAEVKALGPYVNFSVHKHFYTASVLKQIARQKENYGSSKIGKGKRVMVEYFSPNTNKQLTVGHLRNICLGFSTVSLMKFLGYKVTTATLYNDRGIALAKTILSYQKWAEKKNPKQAGMKSDHFVGELYRRFGDEVKNNEALDKEAAKILRQWEEGNKRVRQIWQKLVEWALLGYKETLKELNIPEFDEKYFESEFYALGKEMVEEGLKKGIFHKHQDGYIYAALEKYGLPNKILVRSDGTSLYITQDLYLAKLKSRHQPDISIVVTGNEQDLQFQQLFKILELLGEEFSAKYHHLSYGMMRLPDGKIKSREGMAKGVAADDLIAQLESMATEEIKKRDAEISEEELRDRARIIALGALKFYILSVDAKNTMIFDPAKSLSFVGKTGPYIQYVYARINSIFAKTKIKRRTKIDYTRLQEPIEFGLVKQLSRFPEVIVQSVENYNPSLVANYLYDVAKLFSAFYEQVPVVQAEKELQVARLVLIESVRQVLANGLDLLGIEAPEKM